jgi:hypothetical protein
MEEAYRCLKPGGTFEIMVPSTDGRGAFQDPTHKTWWNMNSFSYYCQNAYNPSIAANYKLAHSHYGIKCHYYCNLIMDYTWTDGNASTHAVLKAIK